MTEITPIEGDDPELNAAIEEARRRLPEFRRAMEEDWRRMIPCIYRSLVKASFQSEMTGTTEHMWVDVFNFEGDDIIGTLANDPKDIPELSQGDEVKISPKEISDWLYSVDGENVGGFTLAILERRNRE